MSYGPDWKHVAGSTEGLSATCYRGESYRFVPDLPITATFSSTSPYKWPQIVFSCYGNDLLGHDVVRGYGALPIPTIPGRLCLLLVIVAVIGIAAIGVIAIVIASFVADIVTGILYLFHEWCILSDDLALFLLCRGFSSLSLLGILSYECTQFVNCIVHCLYCFPYFIQISSDVFHI
ncbi:B9 protein [Cooperia oncophora]